MGKIEGFIKYAKEEFNLDISLAKSDTPDSFESLFGGIVENTKETHQSMEKILNAIQEKKSIGHKYLEINFGSLKEDGEEGYYLSQINGWGSTPITEILATNEEIYVGLLIKELDKLDVAHCF